jgi:hypothetical protein
MLEAVICYTATQYTLTKVLTLHLFFLRDGKPMTRLAKEVQEAIAADPMYGPQYDKERHMVGVEYEVVLEQTLLEMGKSYHIIYSQ